MKIVHPYIERQIDFNQNNCYELIIENSNQFFRLSSDIINQCNNTDGDFVISDYKILDFSKICLSIYDFYNFNTNTKKISNLINAEVSDILKNGDFLQEFSVINKMLIDINDKIKDELDFTFQSVEDFDYDKFIKFSNFKLEKSGDLLSDMIDYITVMQKLSDLKVVVFINASCVFNEKQINDIIKQLTYMQLNILFINNNQKYFLKDIEHIIIDNDLCEI